MSDIKTLLCQQFAVSDVDYEKAVGYQSKYNGRLEQILINMGALSEEKLPQFYHQFLSIELFATAGLEAQPEHVSEHLELEQHLWLKERGWLVLDIVDNDWTLVTIDPLEMAVNQWFGQKDINARILVCTNVEFEQLASTLIAQSEELFSVDLSSSEEARLREIGKA